MTTLLLIVCSSILLLLSPFRITLYLNSRLLSIIRKRREMVVPLLMQITLFLSMIRFFLSSDNLTNDPLLELPEFELFHFDLYDDPSFPRPPPEPPDVEICLNFEPNTAVINNFDELNVDECFYPGGGEINVSQNVEDDDSFTFVIRTFLSYRTYHVYSPLLLSTGSDDTIFDPSIST
ncbi:hypothetical protein Tco_0107015 [Tanacetum coccineum]